MKPIEQILALETKALEYQNKNNLNATIKYRSEALMQCHKHKEIVLSAILFQRFGDFFLQKDKVQDATLAYEAALRILQKDDQFEFANVLIDFRPRSKAFNPSPPDIPNFYSPTVAGDLKEAAKDTLLNVKLMINAGNAYLSQGQSNPAHDFYQQALKQANIDEAPLLKAYALSNLGEIAWQKKQSDEALDCLQKAIDLFDQYGADTDKRKVLAIQANIALSKNQLDKAKSLFKSSLALHKKMEDTEGTAKIHAQMGKLYFVEQKLDEANQHFSKALQLAKDNQLKNMLWFIYWGKGYIHAQRKEWEEAANFLKKSLVNIHLKQDNLRTDEGKVAFIDSVKEVYDLVIEVYLQLAKKDKKYISSALNFAEKVKAQALKDIMAGKSRRRYQPPFDPNDLSPLLGTEMGETASAMDIPGMDMIQQAAPSFQVDSFSNSSPDFLDSTTPPTQDQDKEKIKVDIPKRHRIVFYPLKEQLIIWFITSDDQIHYAIAKASNKEIERTMNQFRSQMRADAETRQLTMRNLGSLENRLASTKDFKTLSNELYQLLLAPFEELLNGESLVIEPHGYLWLLPFAALQNKDGQFLIEQMPILYAPSHASLMDIDKETPYTSIDKAKAVIIGNPSMPSHPDFHFSDLPGAEGESKNIHQLCKDNNLEVNLFLNDKATTAAIEAQLEVCNILHLSTHGIAFPDRPMDSFIALSPNEQDDGLLKAKTIVNWSIPCELISLSACQTALGKVSSEGVIGLSRSLLIAGARSVLVSQWNVYDRATAVLMEHFYQNYLSGMNKAKALQEAMLFTMGKTDYQHPIYWAAFTLLGTDINYKKEE